MALDGDWAKLRQLVSDMSKVSKKAFPAAAEAAEEGVTSEFRAGFLAQRDPFGQPWAPTKTGKTPVLYTSGGIYHAMINSAGGTVRVRPARYWGYQQHGANGITPRAIVPYGPSAWDKPIQDRVEDAVLELLPPGD
jgi:hypothetical protein